MESSRATGFRWRFANHKFSPPNTAGQSYVYTFFLLPFLRRARPIWPNLGLCLDGLLLKQKCLW
jgi:hypothetical protein